MVADVIREVRLHQVEEQEGSRPVALVGLQDRPRAFENRLHGRLQPHLGGLQVLAEAAQQQVLGEQLAAQARFSDQRQQAEQALVPRRHQVPDAVNGLETAAEAENVGGHHVGRHHVGAVAEGAQAFGQAGYVLVDVAGLSGSAVLVRHEAGEHRGGGGQRPAAAGARLVEPYRARRRVRQAMVAPGVHRVPPQAVGHQQHDVLRRVHARSPPPMRVEGKRYARSAASVCGSASRQLVCSSLPCGENPNRSSGENTRAKSSARKNTANLRAYSSRRRR